MSTWSQDRRRFDRATLRGGAFRSTRRASGRGDAVGMLRFSGG